MATLTSRLVVLLCCDIKNIIIVFIILFSCLRRRFSSRLARSSASRSSRLVCLSISCSRSMNCIMLFNMVSSVSLSPACRVFLFFNPVWDIFDDKSTCRCITVPLRLLLLEVRDEEVVEAVLLVSPRALPSACCD